MKNARSFLSFLELHNAPVWKEYCDEFKQEVLGRTTRLLLDFQNKECSVFKTIFKHAL
jgi:hypothetical protein